MPKMTALTPVNHDGKDYAEGDTFDVSDKAQVNQLVDSKSASVKGQKPKADVAVEAAAVADAAAAAADAQAILDAAALAATAAPAAQGD